MTKELIKDLSYFLALPYTIVLRRDDEGDVVARIEELAGCVAHGETETEALANLQEMQKLWISDCIESGQPVPEPESEDQLPSGKWVQRVPRSLHQKLVRQAKREQVSLNQLVTSLLSEALVPRAIDQRIREWLTPREGVSFVCDAPVVWHAAPPPSTLTSRHHRWDDLTFTSGTVIDLGKPAPMNLVESLAAVENVMSRKAEVHVLNEKKIKQTRLTR